MLLANGITQEDIDEAVELKVNVRCAARNIQCAA